jgi:hypothetical protein
MKQYDGISREKLLLESQLHNAHSTVTQLRNDFQLLQSEYDSQRELYLQVVDELKRLQERSQSMSVVILFVVGLA